MFSGAFTGNALVDRLTHNAYLVNMNGVSYRLKETKDFNQKIQKKDG
ncbi:ATP-binding protein [Prevotella lacticifex]